MRDLEHRLGVKALPKTVSDKDLERLLEEITDTETEDIMRKKDPTYKWIRQIMI